MNFSIIMPGGCDGHCNFCFWKEQPVSTTYLRDLESTLKNLPEGLNLSITGGEPTISKYFAGALPIIKKYKSKFEKVIMTTNGSHLHAWIDSMNGIVDHINVSRHHFNSDVRESIFENEIAPDFYLKPVIEKLNENGIDVTFNAVLCGVISTKEDVLRFITYAKDMGVSSVCFRKDYGEDDELIAGSVESLFENYKSTYTYDCPVCRTKVQLINGMRVVWKSSSYEPSVYLKDIYELVLQPSGKLTIDWAAEHEVKIYNGAVISGSHLVSKYISPAVKQVAYVPSIIRVQSYSGCGVNTSRYSGCGITTSRYSGCGINTSANSGCGN